MRPLPPLVLLAACAAALAGTAWAAGPWSRVAPLPHPRSAHAVVVARGGIYVLGGPSTAAVDRPDGRRWKRETTNPGVILNAPAAVALGGSGVRRRRLPRRD